jgi:hypothetical protein
MTAIGTVAVAVVAVGVALYTERRAGVRLRAEQERSDRLVREERELGDARLAEERRIAQEREQFAAAYAVQVTFWLRGYLTAAIVNHSAQTITRIEVRFSPDGSSVIPPSRQERLILDTGLPGSLQLARLMGDYPQLGQFLESAGAAFPDTLTPWDAGMFAQAHEIAGLPDPRVIVRWIDRWGTRWEYKRSDVRMIDESAPWIP